MLAIATDAPVSPTLPVRKTHPDERYSYLLHIDAAELTRLRAVLAEQLLFMWGSRNTNPFSRPLLRQIIRLALAARDAWEVMADISECPRYRVTT